VCNALGLPSGFISLGGLSSSEYLLGHSYTYEGSRWGKIAEVLMHAEYSNPVLFFDELDKVSTSRTGEEIINTLIHITDHTQNHNFRDKYFSEVALDLSRCIIIFSYNNGDLVNPILKDRMVTIKASGYNQTDKIEICKKHMIPKILKEYAFNSDDIKFSDEILRHIITMTQDEEGVRQLKRALEDIVSNINVHRLLKQSIGKDKQKSIEFPLNVTEDITKMFLSKKRESNFKHNMMYI
jgi:ATP-dependent Lon protease